MVTLSDLFRRAGPPRPPVSERERELEEQFGPRPTQRTPMPRTTPYDFITFDEHNIVISSIIGWKRTEEGTLYVALAGGISYAVKDPTGERAAHLVDTFTLYCNTEATEPYDAPKVTLTPEDRDRLLNEFARAEPRPWKETPEEGNRSVVGEYARNLARSDAALIRVSNSQETDRERAERAWLGTPEHQRVTRREIMFKNLEATCRRAMELLDENSTLRGERNEAQTQVAELVRENGSFERELKGTRERLKATHAAFYEAAQQRDELTTELRAMTRQRDEYLAANEVAGREVEQAKAEAAHFASQIRELETSRQSWIDRVEQQKAALADRAAEIAGFKEEVSDLHDSLQLVRADLDRTRDEADSREAHLNTAIADRDATIQTTASQLLDARAQLGRIRQIAGVEV